MLGGLGMGSGGGRGGAAAPASAPVNLIAPAISGEPSEGQTLTCDGGSWSGSPSLTYQWLRDDVDIVGATSATYLMVSDDIGAMLSCEVTATNGAGSAGPIESNTLGPGLDGRPVNSVAPVIEGSAIQGQTLTLTNVGTWSNSPTTYGYQWERDGSPIVDETGQTYDLQAADVGADITCDVLASNPIGDAIAGAVTSNTIGPIASTIPVNTGAPSITGSATYSTSSATTLTVSNNGTWTNSPTSYTYQWQRDGVNIGGETTSDYTLEQGDIGTSIRCQVTAVNAAGSSAAANTGAIGPVVSRPINTVAPVVSGSVTAGQPLSTTNGTWVGTPTSYAYEWFSSPNADGSSATTIAGETDAVFTSTTDLEGLYVFAAVEASNAVGATNSIPFSNVVGPISVSEGLPSTDMEFDVSYVAGGPPIYTINFVDIHAGDYIRIQQTTTVTGGVGDYTSTSLDMTHQVQEVEVAAEALDPDLMAADGYSAPGGGDWGERTRWERDGSDPGPWSELTGSITSSTTALVATSGPDKSTNFVRTGAHTGSVTANVGAAARMGCRYDAAPVNTKFHAEVVLDGAAANQTIGIGCCEPWNGTDGSGTGTNINSSFPVAMPGFSTAMNGFSVQMSKGSTLANLTINGSGNNVTIPAAADGDALIIEVDTAINKMWAWHRTAAGSLTALNSGGTTLTSKIPSVYRLYLRGAGQGGTPTTFHGNVDPADFLETPSTGFDYYA